ncbi:MAG: acyl carrier protein [Verrucomicrobiota bacterium]
MNEEELRDLLSRVCERDLARIGLDDDFSRLGLDSLTGLRMLAAVEKHADVRFPDDRLEQFRTLRAILDHLQQASES